MFMPNEKYMKSIDNSIETIVSLYKEGDIDTLNKSYIASVESNNIANTILDFDSDLLKVMCECDMFRNIREDLPGKQNGTCYLKPSYSSYLPINNANVSPLLECLFSLIDEYQPFVCKLFQHQDFHRFIHLGQYVRNEFVVSMYDIACKMKCEYQSIFYRLSTRKIEPYTNADVMSNVLDFLA